MCVYYKLPGTFSNNSAELPQRDVTVWEFAIFGYFPCIIRTVRTRSFNHKHKHRKMAIFKLLFFLPFFFCSLNWEFSYSNWEKNILFGIGNTTEYRSSKRAKKNPERDQTSLLLFHEIHCRTMSIDKDKYSTPSHRSKLTRSSHNFQYCRP